MSSPLWSADGVFLARIADDVVVLDVPRDAYACLVGAGAWLFPRPDGRLEVADEVAAVGLIKAGLAAGAPPGSPRRAPITPMGELPLAGRASPAGAVCAALSLARATLVFRGAPLDRLLRLSAPLSCSGPALEARLAGGIADWAAALPWVPREGECLQRAFQLRRLLTGRGVAADWVFGVRTWPFAAHCWIQVGDRVVGDRLDRVRGYTPIMVA